jgi:hypothetical protein
MISEKEIKDAVRDSVYRFIWDSVDLPARKYIQADSSVWISVWAPVCNSVSNSVRSSVNNKLQSYNFKKSH